MRDRHQVFPYRLFGLSLHSHLPLPELQVDVAAAARPPDVVVELADPVADERNLRFRLEGAGQEISLTLPRAGRFEIRDGSRIRIAPAAAGNADDLRAALLGPVWAAVCYQRRRLILHCSACSRNGRATAFCSSSGGGKSTLLAGLVNAGWRPLADDTTALEFGPDGGASIFAGVPRHRLWPDSIRSLGWERADWRPVASSEVKLQITWSEVSPAGPVPLDAIYLLDWGEVRIERMTGTDALQSVARAAVYAPWLLAQVFPLSEYWGTLVEVLRRVPLFRFHRPSGWAEFERGLGLLQSHLASHL